MMFQGSEHVGDDEHFKIVSDAGGTMNGFTGPDATTYFETLPENHLETALWLEADRMGFLLPAVTEEKFEIQRATVKNERGQSVDNVPYGRVYEVLAEHLYPAGHPYSWPVIGWPDDLDRAELTDLQRFFLRWYGPNNAVLSVGGDFDPARALMLIDKYLGSLPAGPDVEPQEPQPVVLETDRHVTLEDAVPVPALVLDYPTVHTGHPDQPALDAATKLIGEGPASLLQQRLVQTGEAIDAYAVHLCMELACEFLVVVVPTPGFGKPLSVLEATARDLLDEFASSEVTSDVLETFRGPYERNRASALESVDGKVSDLATAELSLGSPQQAVEREQAYLSVSPSDVQRVASQYLAGASAVALSIVPKGATRLAAAPADHEAPSRAVAGAGESASEELRTPVDDFDRSKQPIAREVKPVLPGSASWNTALQNDAPVIGIRDEETPQLGLAAIFDVGSRDDPPGKAGLCALTIAMMQESSLTRSSGDFATALDRIGASVGLSSPSAYKTLVQLQGVSAHADQAIELWLERMLAPAFLQQDFERVQAQFAEALQQQAVDPAALAERATGVALFGPDHPLSYPALGTPSTFEQLNARRRDLVLRRPDPPIPARGTGELRHRVARDRRCIRAPGRVAARVPAA
jgi:zinc protease